MTELEFELHSALRDLHRLASRLLDDDDPAAKWLDEHVWPLVYSDTLMAAAQARAVRGPLQ